VRLGRLLMLAAGGMAVVGAFFFGTLFILNRLDSQARDALRVEHVKLLKAALDRYNIAHGSYPAPYFDNPITDLRAALVDGGYLSAIPVDPLWAGTQQQYRYVSAGPTYGLLLHLELAHEKLEPGACLTGVGIAGTGWWGTPPNCPF
jgi:hypothetical protein